MYRYYLGTKSNLSTRRDSDPIVIDAEHEAKEVIEKWLNRHLYDLDTLLVPIEKIIGRPFKNIDWKEKLGLIFYCDDGSMFFASFPDKDEPYCEIQVDKNEFVLLINETSEIIKCNQAFNDIRVGFEKDKKEIFFSNKDVVVVIETENFDTDIFQEIKDRIDELTDWENTLMMTIFVNSLMSISASYDLTIIQKIEDKLQTTKLFVVNGRVMRFQVTNGKKFYIVDEDGCWEVHYDKILFQYSVFDGICTVYTSQQINVNPELLQKIIHSFQKPIEVIYETIQLLNSIMEDTTK